MQKVRRPLLIPTYCFFGGSKAEPVLHSMNSSSILPDWLSSTLQGQTRSTRRRGKSIRLCGGCSVACFVQAYLLCFCIWNCFFPGCVCAFNFAACIGQATLCTFAAACILSFLSADVLLHLASKHSTVLLCRAFPFGYGCAFAACIVQATFLHSCCSLHCFFPRCGFAFASCMVRTTLLRFCLLHFFSVWMCSCYWHAGFTLDWNNFRLARTISIYINICYQLYRVGAERCDKMR